MSGELTPYIIPAAIAAFLLFRFLRFRLVKKRLPQLIKEGAVFVDVRTPGEFASGARPGAVNIPLDAIAARSGELPKDKPIILCCASGARSGIAAGILRGKGFAKVLNAGPWRNTL